RISLRATSNLAPSGGDAGLVATCEQPLHPCLHLVKLPPKGLDDDRVNEDRNRGTVRVVRAELRTLSRVQPPLKEGAEDRRLNLGPIQDRDDSQNRDLLRVHREDVGAIEQTAVEPLDLIGAEETAAFRHL